MDSGRDMKCSHFMGSPIRKSPDHGLLASPRGLSQLATSFFACLRQGIPTHALSSLTIKFTHNTEQTYSLHAQRRIFVRTAWCICVCPSVFSCQRSDELVSSKSALEACSRALTSNFRGSGSGDRGPRITVLAGVVRGGPGWT